MWESYPALHKHFFQSSLCTSRDAKHRSTFSGLHKILTSADFLLNLAVVADAVHEIGTLSESLQRDDVTLPRAYQLISRAIRAIEKLKDFPGRHRKEAEEAIECGLFKGVSMSSEDSRGQVKINLPQFYHNLSDNLHSRLYAQSSSNRSAMSTQSDEFLTLASQMDVLNPHKWPNNIDSPWPDGEEKLQNLCRRFSLNCHHILEGFRDYVDNGGSKIPEQLCPILRAINTLPVTSSDCERGFSTMNLIMSPLRNSLGITRLSSLMFIKLMGPPLQLWNPLPYVNRWLTAHRHADDTRSRRVDPTAQHNKRYADAWDFFK